MTRGLSASKSDPARPTTRRVDAELRDVIIRVIVAGAPR
jgi:hypothetical protein